MGMNMNQQQPAPLAGVATDQAATQGAVTEGSTEARDEDGVGAIVTANAPAAPLSDGRISAGAPVCDVHGETIGVVASYDEQQGKLVIRGGWLFAQDTTLPAETIGDRGASGVYLTQSKEDLLQKYGGEVAVPSSAPLGKPDAHAGQ